MRVCACTQQIPLRGRRDLRGARSLIHEQTARGLSQGICLLHNYTEGEKKKRESKGPTKGGESIREKREERKVSEGKRKEKRWEQIGEGEREEEKSPECQLSVNMLQRLLAFVCCLPSHQPLSFSFAMYHISFRVSPAAASCMRHAEEWLGNS